MLKEIKNETEHYFMDEFGRIQGEYKSWYDNGVRAAHEYYVDGKLHGEHKWWHDNGGLRYHGYYVDGKLHGEYKSWYKNGALLHHGYCVDGKLHGEAKSWYDNGVLRGHRYYDNNVCVHDFLENPLTDIEKMLLVLKYGGLLLPRGEIC